MAQDFLSSLDAALVKGDFDTAELLFLEAAEGRREPLGVLRQAAARIARAGEKERAAELLTSLVAAAKAEDPEAHLGVLREISLCVPHRQPCRRAYVEAFNERHAGDPVALACVKAAEIVSSRQLDEAYARLDTLLRLREGVYVEHPGGWGVGRIIHVAPTTGHLVVDLEQKRGHRVNIGAAASIFRPLPSDHFKAMLFDRRAEIQHLIEDEPAALIRLLLTSFGSPQAVTEVRDRLVPAFVPREKWSAWWGKARAALRGEPHVHVIGAPRAAIELVDAPVSEVDELLDDFPTVSARKRLAIVRKLRLRKEPEIRERLLRAIAALDPAGAQPLETLLLRSTLGDAADAEVASFLRGRSDGPALLNALDADDLVATALRALATVAEYDGLLPYFLEGEAATIEAAATQLREKDPARFAALIAEVFEGPRRHPWAFFWLTSVRFDPAWEESLAGLGAHDLLLRHLGLLDFLFRADRREEAKAPVAYGRAVLAQGRSRCFRKLIEQSDPAALREVHQHVTSNRALKEDVRSLMIEQIALKSPEAVVQEREVVGEAHIDTAIIYATKAGFERRQAEFQDIVHEKIPEAVREVGRAQACGDLSENAEWTAAIEKRDHLAARARDLEAELRKVTLITPALYRNGRVSLGSRVTVRDTADNQEHVWLLLGPWDGDLDHGVLSYLSPVGRTLLGRRVGEVVTVRLPESTAQYEIVAVEPAGVV